MDSILSRSDLGEDEKAKQFVQLQNRYLTFKQQLNRYTPSPARNRPEGVNTSYLLMPSTPPGAWATYKSAPAISVLGFPF